MMTNSNQGCDRLARKDEREIQSELVLRRSDDISGDAAVFAMCVAKSWGLLLWAALRVRRSYHPVPDAGLGLGISSNASRYARTSTNGS